MRCTTCRASPHSQSSSMTSSYCLLIGGHCAPADQNDLSAACRCLVNSECRSGDTVYPPAQENIVHYRHPPQVFGSLGTPTKRHPLIWCQVFPSTKYPAVTYRANSNWTSIRTYLPVFSSLTLGITWETYLNSRYDVRYLTNFRNDRRYLPNLSGTTPDTHLRCANLTLGITSDTYPSVA